MIRFKSINEDNYVCRYSFKNKLEEFYGKK